MTLERRRGFKRDKRGMTALVKSRNVTGQIALNKAHEVAALAGNVAGSYSDTGDLAKSYDAKIGPGYVVLPEYGAHAYAVAFSNDEAAPANEFGGRKGRGPRQPRRILFRAGLVFHVPRRPR